MQILTITVYSFVLFTNATNTLDALWIVKDIFAMFVDFPDRVKKRRANPCPVGKNVYPLRVNISVKEPLKKTPLAIPALPIASYTEINQNMLIVLKYISRK